MSSTHFFEDGAGLIDVISLHPFEGEAGLPDVISLHSFEGEAGLLDGGADVDLGCGTGNNEGVGGGGGLAGDDSFDFAHRLLASRFAMVAMHALDGVDHCA